MKTESPPQRTPHEVIRESVQFDHLPSSNAKRILNALKAEGYAIVSTRRVSPPAEPRCPELERLHHG